ncbi:MAG: TRAP transporter small permease subunit [Burkholderiales bacterium]
MRRFADGLAVLTGWALLIYCFAVGIEIVGRRYFGFSLQGVDEIGGYLMALIVAIGFSCALYADAHIRIDILLPRLPRRVTLWLNAATQAALAGFAVFLVWHGCSVLTASYRLKSVAPTPLLTPLAVPQALWLAALLLFLAAALACFVRDLRIAVRGGDAADRPISR